MGLLLGLCMAVSVFTVCDTKAFAATIDGKEYKGNKIDVGYLWYRDYYRGTAETSDGVAYDYVICEFARSSTNTSPISISGSKFYGVPHLKKSDGSVTDYFLRLVYSGSDSYNGEYPSFEIAKDKMETYIQQFTSTSLDNKIAKGDDFSDASMTKIYVSIYGLERHVDRGGMDNNSDKNNDSESDCDHSFELRTIREASPTEDGCVAEVCTKCGYRKNEGYIPEAAAAFDEATNKIKNAKGDVVIELGNWHSLPSWLMKEIAARRDINITLRYMYNHKLYEVVVPKGVSITLDPQIKYYGPKKLADMFGAKEL